MSNEINSNENNSTAQNLIAEALEQQKKRADVLELALTEAEGKVKQFEEALTASKKREETLAASVDYWANQWRGVEAALTEFFEDGTLTEGVPLDDYLIETFDIQTTEVVEVTLTITYSGMATIPKGADMTNFTMEASPDYDVNIELEGDIVGNLTFQATDYDY
jgi:hypothetical protein